MQHRELDNMKHKKPSIYEQCPEITLPTDKWQLNSQTEYPMQKLNVN